MNAFDKFVEELLNKEDYISSEIPKHSGNKNTKKIKLVYVRYADD
jgi:hypothetical protein